MAELERKETDSRVVGELTYKITLDVSEALTGLKAVQREARKAAAAIAELHAVSEASPQITVNVSVPKVDAVNIDEVTRELAERVRKQTGVRM